jgi:hypothetical protein
MCKPAGIIADSRRVSPKSRRRHHLDGGVRHAAELHYPAQRDDDHVGVGVPVHVVDESGRKRHLVEHHTVGARERLAEQVAVDLMAGDVPPVEYLLLDLLDLLDVKQLDF